MKTRKFDYRVSNRGELVAISLRKVAHDCWSVWRIRNLHRTPRAFRIAKLIGLT